MLDEIVAEYERGVMFDGQRLVATGERDGLDKSRVRITPGRNSDKVIMLMEGGP